MNITIECAPAYALAYIHLEHGESFRLESDAMVAMSDGIEVSAATGGGGVTRGLLRKAVGGESYFMGNYRAVVHGAWVAAAPRMPGDITAVNLADTGVLMVQNGSLLGMSAQVTMTVAVAGAATVVGREGLTMLKVAGRGSALLSSYGGIQSFDLNAGQSLVVDTGHLVAYSAGMSTTFGMLGGVTAAMASGEGMVMKLSGPGHVLIQTRADHGLRSWLFPENATSH